MKLGRESEYAVEGLLALAKRPLGTTILLHDIAVPGKIPESFLAKIFQKLTRTGVIQSSRGAVRGYALARRAKDIKVKDVFLAIEGRNCSTAVFFGVIDVPTLIPVQCISAESAFGSRSSK